MIKKALPAKFPNCNNNNNLIFQRFAGEDLSGDERKVLLIEQQRAFLQQQIAEREAADTDRKRAEAEYHAALKARNMRSLELENLEKECRRKLDCANLRYNMALVSLLRIILPPC